MDELAKAAAAAPAAEKMPTKAVPEDEAPSAAAALADMEVNPTGQTDSTAPQAEDEQDNEATEDEEEAEDTDPMTMDVEELPKDFVVQKDQNEDHKRTTAGDEAAQGEDEEDEAVKNAEMSYSTRGRSGDIPPSSNNNSSSGNNILSTSAAPVSALELLAESSHREEAQLSREKDQATPTIGPSFLSDSLTEEERRTRTRYIPNVDGMNMLRKQEIKGDLALARVMTTSAGVASTLGRKARRAAAATTREDDMDVDDAVAPSDDDKASEILRLGTRTMEVAGMEYTLPSPAFVAPPIAITNGDLSSAVRGSKPTPPTEVETVMAFNPPRPPESIGPKKKHRMLRWERRPADIEVDLSTYRKTVQKTREELKKAATERDRIEMMDNHLRRHYLNHLECMNQELVKVAEETAVVQQQCVTAADLLTSRTRSRGAGKSSYIMRDVLAVLRTRGVELQEKGLSLPEPASGDKTTTLGPARGVGGVGAKSFQRWDNTKPILPQQLCSGWAGPGDKVKTPYGEGTVITVLPSSRPDPSETPAEGLYVKRGAKDSDAMEVDQTEKKAAATTEPKKRVRTDLDNLIAPRVAVQLSFGTGFFPPEDVKPLEDPSSFSDSRMAVRWRSLMETSYLFGDALDVEAMTERLPPLSTTKQSAADGVVPSENGVSNQEAMNAARQAGLLPFGSDLIPTSAGRGAFVAQTGMVELDETLDTNFFRSTNVLGAPDNIGVPEGVKTAEEKQSQRILLKAKLCQLRNEVSRQRHIRQLNQRTYNATKERAARIESLVSEMRTDLKSLKRRLDEETRALGIDEKEAEKILLAYYSRDQSGESPFKRARKNAEMDLDTEDDDDEIQDGLGVPAQEASV